MVSLQVKGLSTEELAARNDLVLALPDRIQAIPDGAAAPPKQSGGWAASASRTEIRFDSGGVENQFYLIVFVFCFSLISNSPRLYSVSSAFSLNYRWTV